jgi:hypothetical protein
MPVREIRGCNLGDRRAVARYAGSAGTPDESGARRRDNGLSQSLSETFMRHCIGLPIDRRRCCGVRDPRSPARRVERRPMPEHLASSATKPEPSASRPQVSLAARGAVGSPQPRKGRPPGSPHRRAAGLMQCRMNVSDRL